MAPDTVEREFATADPRNKTGDECVSAGAGVVTDTLPSTPCSAWMICCRSVDASDSFFLSSSNNKATSVVDMVDVPLVVTKGREILAVTYINRMQAQILHSLLATAELLELKNTLSSILRDMSTKKVQLHAETALGLQVSGSVELDRRVLQMLLEALETQNLRGIDYFRRDLERIIAGTHDSGILFPFLASEGM